MCDHCGCRDHGAVGLLMRQHDLITALAKDVRGAISAGELIEARERFSELLTILKPHNAWEDRGLFERMARHSKYAEQVRALHAEHVELHDAVARADMTPLGWGPAILAVLDRLDEHIRKENLGLFPAALSVLDTEDWAAVDAASTGCACGGRCGDE